MFEAVFADGDVSKPVFSVDQSQTKTLSVTFETLMFSIILQAHFFHDYIPEFSFGPACFTLTFDKRI